MKRLSWKYIAGLVDGEGCIDFQVTYHKSYPGRPYIQPRLRIAMADSARFVLEMLLANHGGNLFEAKRNNKNEAWQDASYWTVQGKALRPVLQNIVNHMYIKKEQAKLAIWMIDNVMGKHIGDDLREHLKAELKAMKRDPHRLSEAAASVANDMLKDHLDNKPWSRNYSSCISCNTTDTSYAGNGYCRSCYEKHQSPEQIEKRKQQSRDRAMKAYYRKKELADAIVGLTDG
jgi:hypothetical protein